MSRRWCSSPIPSTRAGDFTAMPVVTSTMTTSVFFGARSASEFPVARYYDRPCELARAQLLFGADVSPATSRHLWCLPACARGNEYLLGFGAGEGNGGRQVPLRTDRAGRSTSASISFVLFTFAEFHTRFGRNFTGTTSFDILTRFKSPPTQPLRYSRVSGADCNNSRFRVCSLRRGAGTASIYFNFCNTAARANLSSSTRLPRGGPSTYQFWICRD